MLNILLKVASMVGVGMILGRCQLVHLMAAILVLVEESGSWPVHLLDAYIAMIPKEGGDATPFGKRPLSVFLFVYVFTLWTTVSVTLKTNLNLGFPSQCSLLGGCSIMALVRMLGVHWLY